MRKKSITIFLSVYAALCIAYGVGTSVVMPDNTEIIAAVGQESSQISYLTSNSDDNISETSKTESSVQNEDVFIPVEPEPSVISDNELQQSEEQIEEDDGDEYTGEKPSLEEFLKILRCSGCRHNCTLFSPRCMNGARKASQAQSQYYEIYGG